MSHYLITGGAGFIGSHLTDALLAAGHQVRVLDDLSTGKRANLDKRAELVVGNVAEPSTVQSAMRDVDGCFHLAAIASVVRSNMDWLGSHRVNLGGSICVLDAARREGGLPVVYASSAAVYGASSGIAAESSTTTPLSSYGADKLGSELHAQTGFQVHGVPSIGFRFFNVYGPRQDPSSPYSGVISLFSAALRDRRPISMHGDGLQTRDFVYVGDVISLLLAGMQHAAAYPAAQVLNACTGRETSVRQLAETIGSLLHRRPVITVEPARPGDIRRSVGSPILAKAVFGIQPSTPLVTGLKATLGSPSLEGVALALERA